MHVLPQHVAIIMDGNGRWAKSRKLPRAAGHKKGADALREVLKCCQQKNIACLTVYAFSAENWKRPKEEVSELMELLKLYVKKERDTLHKNGVRIRFIGDKSLLATDVQALIEEAEQLTSGNEAFSLNVALSYGSRQEITRAARLLAEKVLSGALLPEAIDETALESALYTARLPAPDLLIRTGGEQRLSNFLLWQSAYTEFYFTDVLWPDFGAAEFDAALAEFATRERRYGTTD